MVQRAHKIRIYPTREQVNKLRQTVGTCRSAYNWFIDQCEAAYDAGESWNKYELCNRWTKERPDWATLVSASSVQHSLLNAGKAYESFFHKITGKPKHHKRGVNDSFYQNNQKAKVVGKKLRLEKIGYLKMAEKLRYDDYRLLSVTVKEKAGKWYASILVEIAEEFRTDSTDVVGVDVGCKHWAVASGGTICDSPKKLKYYERCLKKKQRLLARKQKGSNRRVKAKLQVAKAYEKIHNVKLDVIHKFTASIAKRFGTVCIETLNIEGMKRSHITSKGVQNSMMGELQRQLMYKCNNYVKIPMFYPSSKTCSNCGNVKEDLTLSDRTYKCKACGFELDRDLNASLNLRKKGLEIIYGGSHR